jgi:hypothetical protein
MLEQRDPKKGFRRKTWGKKEERNHVQGGLIILKMI